MFNRFKFIHLTNIEQLPCTKYCSGFTGAYIPKEGEKPYTNNTHIHKDKSRVVNIVKKVVKHKCRVERDGQGWAGALRSRALSCAFSVP